MYKVNKDGILFIMKEEGYMLRPYMDVAGHRTIGVGHKLTPEESLVDGVEINGELVGWDKGLTKRQVYCLLKKDIKWVETTINDYVTTTLNQGQVNALASLIFNIGASSFIDSTLLKAINAEQRREVSHQWRRWNKITVGGEKRILDALTRRRMRELLLFENN